MKLLRVPGFVSGHEPRAHRPKGVVGLALGPLPGSLGLKFALGEIIYGAIAGDVGGRVLLVDVLGARADDDAKLDFPIRFLRLGRDGHFVIGPRQTAYLLGEDDRLGRHLQVRFRCVVGIVEADGDELLWISNRRADARIAAHQGERFGLDLLQPGKALGCDRLTGYVGDDRRKITDTAVAVQQSRPLSSLRPVTQQFHAAPPVSSSAD